MVNFSKIGFDSIYDFPVVLPRYYGGVILVGFGSFAMHMFLAKRVIDARRQIDFPAPNMYHPTNAEFNCIQRAHQNYLENLPLFLSGIFIGGLFCPVSASILGAIYLAGRIGYYKGYTSGDPLKRKRGGFSFLAFGLLMLMNAFYGGAHLIASFEQHRIPSVQDKTLQVPVEDLCVQSRIYSRLVFALEQSICRGREDHLLSTQ
ncbi:hypothetical protein Aperf_G00000038934 [Anoplocephala perfoliata]